MIAIKDGETRTITRQRFFVTWCPFCDRSRQAEDLIGLYCDGCNAQFREDDYEVPVAKPRARRAKQSNSETDPNTALDIAIENAGPDAQLE